MGNKQSTVENGCIQELSKINEEELDISRIDKLQIKALKEINSKIEKLNKEKSDKIMIYDFAKVQMFVITASFDLIILA